MHSRFDGAPRAEFRCPGGALNAVVAKSFRLRLLGLMRLGSHEFEPLLIPNCRSIHMHGMRSAIDLVWLQIDEGRARVLDVVEALAPGRHAGAPKLSSGRRTSALELRPGEARRLALQRGAELALA